MYLLTIDTAPTDGTQVLLFVPDPFGGHYVVGYYRSEILTVNGLVARDGSGWRHGSMDAPQHCKPSHWTKLPDKPIGGLLGAQLGSERR